MGQYKPKLNYFTGQMQLVPSGTIIAFKEGVANFAALPATGNTQNDARITNDTGHLYVWSGTAWIDNGDIVDLNWSTISGKPSSAVVDIDDAVSKKHAPHSDDQDLSGKVDKITGSSLVSDSEIVKIHNQDTDVYLNNIVSTSLLVDGNRIDTYIPDGSITKPFKTIQDALNSVSDAGEAKRYEVVIVGGKTYEEQVILKPYVYLRGQKLAIVHWTNGDTITAPNISLASYNIKGLMVVCDSDNETHNALKIIGGTVSSDDCLFQGSAINGASLDGAEGVRISGGNFLSNNVNCVGWNWALNISAGLAICIGGTFSGYGQDVKRTGGTLKLGLPIFTSGGVNGIWTNYYNTPANGKIFISTQQTGTGVAQNIAHGLGVVPTKVIITMYNSGVYTITEGTHTSTNVVVTATSGCKYKVLAQL